MLFIFFFKVSFVILHLRMSLEKKSDLDLILRNFPAAFSLYKIVCFVFRLLGFFKCKHVFVP